MQDQGKKKDILILGNVCKLNTWVHLGFPYPKCIKDTFD